MFFYLYRVLHASVADFYCFSWIFCGEFLVGAGCLHTSLMNIFITFVFVVHWIEPDDVPFPVGVFLYCVCVSVAEKSHSFRGCFKWFH